MQPNIHPPFQHEKKIYGRQYNIPLMAKKYKTQPFRQFYAKHE